MKRRAFARLRQDFASDELVAALLAGDTFEFEALFATVHANLRSRHVYGGGEEMLRLRVYEKLQILVGQGLVTKTGKTYAAVKVALRARSAQLEETKGRMRPGRNSILSPE